MTCFLFGSGIPLLFVVAEICLIVMYLYEKKMLARQTRMPHNFNPQMNEDIVSVILYGPILYACIGYWNYSNPLIMGNEVAHVSHLS